MPASPAWLRCRPAVASPGRFWRANSIAFASAGLLPMLREPKKSLEHCWNQPRSKNWIYLIVHQLGFVIRICRECATLSEAGRKLFGATREKRKVQNDADRPRKYLARFNLDWQACKQ